MFFFSPLLFVVFSSLLFNVTQWNKRTSITRKRERRTLYIYILTMKHYKSVSKYFHFYR